MGVFFLFFFFMKSIFFYCVGPLDATVLSEKLGVHNIMPHLSFSRDDQKVASDALLQRISYNCRKQAVENKDYFATY